MKTRLFQLQGRETPKVRGLGPHGAGPLAPISADGKGNARGFVSKRSWLRLVLALSMTGVGCQDAGLGTAVFDIRSTEASAPKLVSSVADQEALLARLRLVSRSARDADVETFKREAEALLWDPEPIEDLMRSASREGMEYEDQVALVGFVQLALKSYGAARSTAYYGDDFDSSTFVDLAIFDLAPSVTPDCALALIEELAASDLLLPKHSAILVSLASNEDLSDGCHSAMTEGVVRGVFDPEVLHDFVRSRGDRGVEQDILFYKAWRALLASGEAASVDIAMEAALEGGFHEAWNHRLLESFVPLVNSGQLGFESLVRFIDNRKRVESRSVELLMSVDSLEGAEIARQVVLGDRAPESRIYYLALVSKDLEFIDAVARTDESLAVRTWARSIAFFGAATAEERLHEVEGLIRDLSNCTATKDLYSASSRALSVFTALRESVESGSSSPLILRSVVTQLRDLTARASMPTLIGDAFREEAEKMAALIEAEAAR